MSIDYPKTPKAGRIVGLDAIRLIAAATVALGHLGPTFLPLDQDLAPLLGPNVAALVDAARGIAFNGPAAVIVFFVLSGFVIHLPYADRRRALVLGEYAARRYIRIIPPVLAFMIIATLIGNAPRDFDWNNTVLWSIFCELIYYTIYPLLLKARRYFVLICLLAFILALALAAANTTVLEVNAEFTALGWMTFIVGFPAWILGCLLVEGRKHLPLLPAWGMWSMRGAIFGLSVALRAVRFHGAEYVGALSSNVYTLTAFSIIVAVWLGLEIRYFSESEHEGPIVSFLDRAGKASYSLYLVHPIVIFAFHGLWPESTSLKFVLFLVVCAAATAAFYFAIERPSHLAARAVARGLQARRKSRTAPAR